jgi:hypothetical protein
MSVLLFLITFIVGLIVTAVINRLMALFYCFMCLGFGIFLLITYRAALSLFIEFIMFMILGTFLGISAFIFFLLSVSIISEYIERFIAYLKNKK